MKQHTVGLFSNDLGSALLGIGLSRLLNQLLLARVLELLLLLLLLLLERGIVGDAVHDTKGKGRPAANLLSHQV